MTDQITVCATSNVKMTGYKGESFCEVHNSTDCETKTIAEQFGRCTRCGEMTSISDPCCVSVPIEFEGDLVMPTIEDESASDTTNF